MRSSVPTGANAPSLSVLCLLSGLLVGALAFDAAIPRANAAEHHGRVTFGALPVPGATVTATRGSNRVAAITDLQGNYSFPGLADGTWDVTVEMLCFAPLRKSIEVIPGAQAAEWELKLLPLNELGQVAKQSAVRTDKPLLPGAAKAQDSFQRADLKAVPADAAPASAASPREPGAFDGQNPDDLAQRASDGFLINGSSNNSASTPFGMWPAFGNFRKRPGSLYNGNLGIIVDNSRLDARPYSFTGQNMAKPAYNRLTGVLSFGGPLKIPRLWKSGPVVSVNYQWTRNRDLTTQPSLVPTAAERNGDLSQSLNALGKPVQIYDPATGSPFFGSAIPQGRISSQARSLLALYPLPNFSGGLRYNYQASVAGITHQDSLQSRAYKMLDRNNQVSGSFAFQSTRADNSNLFGFLDTSDSTGLNANLGWRRTFGIRLIMNLGYQYSRMTVRNTPFFQNRRDISGEAGISGNDRQPMNWGPPDLVFSGGIVQLTDGRPSFSRDQTSGFSFGASWLRGRHNVTFGADFRRQQFNRLAQQDPRGTFTFTGAATQAVVNGLPVAGTGSDFADFLLGVPDASAIAFGNADKYFRSSASDAYVTDDWRIGPGLTVNAGMRWEYGAPISELYGRLVNLDIAHGFAAAVPVLAGNPAGALTGQSYPDSLVRPDRSGFQPRVGLAWRPFPASSLVVRAGYGVYFNTSVYRTIATQMAQQSPLSKSLSVQNTPSNPLTLANGFVGSPTTTANTFAVDPDFRVGYAQSWQLSVQRDLPRAFVMVANYLGTKGTRGTQQFLPNTYPAGTLNPCPLCPAGFAYLTSNGNSTRQSGQIQLRRRLRGGLGASLQYTFSKSIDDAAFGGRGQGSAVIAQNWLDLGAERALSNFDQRHQLNFQAQYTTGMGVSGGALMTGWKGRFFKEWTVTTQITAGSGFPLTPVYLAPVTGTGMTGSIRPDVTGASIYDAPPGYSLNTAAYKAPAPGRWGNAGRNSVKGPDQFVMNASVGRSFRMRDRVMLDFRVDSTNVINNATFPSWNTTVNGVQFGLPLAANPMRSFQTTLRARF